MMRRAEKTRRRRATEQRRCDCWTSRAKENQETVTVGRRTRRRRDRGTVVIGGCAAEQRSLEGEGHSVRADALCICV
ncbi:hypothetical protein SESBI_29171 [Sesbania bispinosa]|nr:hypothetical protein SESBI_29171 [Sesbania bispinosa]